MTKLVGIVLLVLGMAHSAEADVVQVVVRGQLYTFVCSPVHGCTSTEMDVSDPRLATDLSVAFAPEPPDECKRSNTWARLQAENVTPEMRAAWAKQDEDCARAMRKMQDEAQAQAKRQAEEQMRERAVKKAAKKRKKT